MQQNKKINAFTVTCVFPFAGLHDIDKSIFSNYVSSS